jgi:cell division protein FtsB
MDTKQLISDIRKALKENPDGIALECDEAEQLCTLVESLEWARAEVDKLAEERHELINEVDNLKDHIFDLRAERDKAVESLEWIADNSAATFIEDKARNTLSSLK